jgi:hypothetical protein
LQTVVIIENIEISRAAGADADIKSDQSRLSTEASLYIVALLQVLGAGLYDYGPKHTAAETHAVTDCRYG